MPDHGDDPLASPSARQRQPGGGRGSYRQTPGAHRAEGLTGPTLRYAFIVLVLVVMTSLPVLAAISAGSSTISDTPLPGGATPFIPEPSEGPVVVPLPPSALPPPFAARGGDPIAVMAPSRDRMEPASPPASAQRPVPTVPRLPAVPSLPWWPTRSAGPSVKPHTTAKPHTKPRLKDKRHPTAKGFGNFVDQGLIHMD